MTGGLTVGIVGCGLIGGKRAAGLRTVDRVVAWHDVNPAAAQRLADEHGGVVCDRLAQLLGLRPDVVVVATTHDRLAGISEQALAADAHVLVEKPAGIDSSEVRALIAAQRASGRLVKVGFNHRFHPGIARAAAEVHSGRHGPLLNLRARYGHGGRPGYDREWRADPRRSGGGELIDQGMHLLDLSHWIAGRLPLHSALLRTQFWDTPVEDNAALILGSRDAREGPWAMLHVTWTEWKNLFSVEIYCRTAKLAIDGLGRSYGPQRLLIYRMGAGLGPPALEQFDYPDVDGSWEREWEHFADAIEAAAGSGASQASGTSAGPARVQLLGDLDDALYAWEVVEAAYAANAPYAAMRGGGVA